MGVSSTDFQNLDSQHQVGFLSNVDDAVAKNPSESHRLIVCHVRFFTTYWCSNKTQNSDFI